ncbi:fatty acyl-AMP ligase [Rubricoccus marinus]|uniref:Uncharacterized protein n=1 Tax=Rubricoccus marinus TaxID=716817 RepID=A0A259U1U3_9BACT|nr:fatty acyl-AMP ligase [Rubricoccus marinus]OZC03952.1 hypothetical protein BSZ36_13755 [Rubricoccus marinus]
MSQPSTLVDILLERASQETAAPVIYLPDGESDEVRLTYGEIDRHARALAAQLQTMTQPGDRAMLLFAPGHEAILGFFGALYAGLYPVPVLPPRPGQSPDDLLSFAADSKPSVLLTSAAIAPMIQGMLAATGSQTPVVAADAPEASGDDWTRPDVSRDDIATLLYTSGSTRRPRGTRLTHRVIIDRLRPLKEMMERISGHESPIVSWAPLSHAMGLFANVLQPLYCDRTAVILSPVAFMEKPTRWLHAITRYEGGITTAPNFALQMCVDRSTPEDREGLDLSTWKAIALGSEAIRLDTLDAFAEMYEPYGFDRRAYQMAYGMSEGFGVGTFYIEQAPDAPVHLATAFDRDELLDGRAVAVSPEAPGAQMIVRCGIVPPNEDRTVTVFDPETHLPLPEGRVGEMWIRGASVADGYWENPEATAETFGGVRADTGEGGYLRSGDLGFYHEGQLYVAGRLKDMIIVRGKNLYSVDVEALAENSHPALVQGASAAFSIEENGEEQLVTIVETEEAEPDVESIASAVRQAVGEAINLPVLSVVVVEAGSLPRTRSGKIQRYKAREQFLAAR